MTLVKLNCRLRLAVENNHGKFSSTWMFWGKRSDFYFGAKSALGAFKVSLHENGRGYAALHRPYFEKKLSEGIDIPARTMIEWKLPNPAASGAVNVAKLILPADYCRSIPLDEKARKKTHVLNIEDGYCKEIGVFLSREQAASAQSNLMAYGAPMFAFRLENEMHVTLVARSLPFDRACLPSKERLAQAKAVRLIENSIFEIGGLNMMLFNDPGDGGTLQVADIGGVRWRNNLRRTEGIR